MGEGSELKGLRIVGARTSPFAAPVTNIKSLSENGFLVRNLVRREVRGRYRNAMLGYAWTVIEPTLLSIVYWFLFIMLAGNPDKYYAVWVLIGVIVWNFGFPNAVPIADVIVAILLSFLSIGLKKYLKF